MNGLILGRSPNLWLGAFVAIFAVVSRIAEISPETTALVTAAAGAVIALVAGSDRVQIAAGEAAKDRATR